MPITQNDLSRFKQTSPVILNGIETFGLWSRPSFVDPSTLQDEDIITMSIDQQHAGRPDLIAYEVYDTPALEWVIVMFNKPLNPLGWPFVGTVIKLPTKAAIVREL